MKQLLIHLLLFPFHMYKIQLQHKFNCSFLTHISDRDDFLSSLLSHHEKLSYQRDHIQKVNADMVLFPQYCRKHKKSLVNKNLINDIAI